MTGVGKRRTLLVEAALLLVSLTVVAGFARLFVGSTWVVPLLAAALVAHLASGAARRLELGISATSLAIATATFLLMCWTQAAGTLYFGLPTVETTKVLGAALRDAADLYPTVRAPTVPTAGFVIASMLGVAVIATMSDIATFRVRAFGQALVPPLTLFVLCSMLGSGEHRVAAAGAFAAASLTYLLLARAADSELQQDWLPGDVERGPRSLLRLGGGLAALAVLGGVVVGPTMPGARGPGLWDWRGGGSGARIILSPLVDVRSRLVNQSDDVAFTVRSSERSYWRLMALDRFDGESWTGARTAVRGVSGTIGGRGGLIGPRVEQVFEIDRLRTAYLPAAYQVVAVDSGEEDVSWDDWTQTLLLAERDEAASGYRYSVTSVLPDFDPEVLRASVGEIPPHVVERYLELPALDPRVIALADQIVAGAPTTYDRALAIQNFLREEFEYSLDVPAGSGEAELVRFLFEVRAGYCEQFATAYGALARAAGLPSRVAVGFTVGEQSESDPELFVVRGKHAHTWPEVWFPGSGWVPFEPTPDRGAPGAERWTEVEEAQVADAVETPANPTTSLGSGPTTSVDLDALPDIFPEEPSGAAPAGGPAQDGPPAVLLWFLTGISAIASWALLVTSARLLRIWRRRAAAAGDSSRRCLVAWDEVVEEARRTGFTPAAGETHTEFAARLDRLIPEHRAELIALATAAASARFSRHPLDPSRLDAALDAAAAVRHALSSKLAASQHLLGLVDPTRVLIGRHLRSRAQRRQSSAVLPA